MADWQIAIPSFNRPTTVAKKTLRMLHERNVPPERVRVFVADGTDAESYRACIPDWMCAEVVPLEYDPYEPKDTPVGERPTGLALARNLINRWYPVDTALVQIDDDLVGLSKRTDAKHLDPVEDVAHLISESFGLAEMEGCWMWGVYPVRNPFFMKDHARKGLLFCSGGFYGVRLRHTESEQVMVSCKDDWERSLNAYMADGKVLRRDDIAMDTKVYSGPGGMQAIRTPQMEADSVAWLVATFPELVAPSERKGKAELRMKRRDAHPTTRSE